MCSFSGSRVCFGLNGLVWLLCLRHAGEEGGCTCLLGKEDRRLFRYSGWIDGGSPAAAV